MAESKLNAVKTKAESRLWTGRKESVPRKEVISSTDRRRLFCEKTQHLFFRLRRGTAAVTGQSVRAPLAVSVTAGARPNGQPTFRTRRTPFPWNATQTQDGYGGGRAQAPPLPRTTLASQRLTLRGVLQAVAKLRPPARGCPRSPGAGRAPAPSAVRRRAAAQQGGPTGPSPHPPPVPAGRAPRPPAPSSSARSRRGRLGTCHERQPRSAAPGGRAALPGRDRGPQGSLARPLAPKGAGPEPARPAPPGPRRPRELSAARPAGGAGAHRLGAGAVRRGGGAGGGRSFRPPSKGRPAGPGLPVARARRSGGGRGAWGGRVARGLFAVPGPLCGPAWEARGRRRLLGAGRGAPRQSGRRQPSPAVAGIPSGLLEAWRLPILVCGSRLREQRGRSRGPESAGG